MNHARPPLWPLAAAALLLTGCPSLPVGVAGSPLDRAAAIPLPRPTNTAAPVPVSSAPPTQQLHAHEHHDAPKPAVSAEPLAPGEEPKGDEQAVEEGEAPVAAASEEPGDEPAAEE
jgi:hypothetical protein